MDIPRDDLLATRYERIFAWFLDVLIATAVLGGGVLVLSSIGLPSVALVVLAWIAGVLFWPLFMIREGDRNGQTPAKQIVGLRVVKVDGTPMDFKTAFIRDGLLKALLGWIFLIISWAVSLGRDDKRMLQDQIAGTFVPRAAGRWISPPDGVVQPPAA